MWKNLLPQKTIGATKTKLFLKIDVKISMILYSRKYFVKNLSLSWIIKNFIKNARENAYENAAKKKSEQKSVISVPSFLAVC